MIEYDSKANLQHYPLPMARFGTNPFGEPLYRIVRTESRRHLIGGMWGDGEVGYHWVKKYPTCLAPWILERWKSAYDYAGSKAEWDRLVDPMSGYLLLGPYPDRGEYDLSYEFPVGVPVGNLENIIGAIERGRHRSYQDLVDFERKDQEYERNETRANCDAEIRDAVTAFGIAPISSLTGVSRGTKNPPTTHSPQELGLPVPNRRAKPKKTGVRGLEVSTTFMSSRPRERVA